MCVFFDLVVLYLLVLLSCFLSHMSFWIYGKAWVTAALRTTGIDPKMNGEGGKFNHVQSNSQTLHIYLHWGGLRGR